MYHSSFSTYLFIKTTDVEKMNRFLKQLSKGLIRFDKQYIIQERFLLSYVYAWRKRIPVLVDKENPFVFCRSLVQLAQLFKLEQCSEEIIKEFFTRIIDLCDGWELLNDFNKDHLCSWYLRKQTKVRAVLNDLTLKVDRFCV